MTKKVVLLSIPGLREKDIANMPRLRQLMSTGGTATLQPSFPCVTCPVQANMTTGRRPAIHGVVANGFYWRDRGQVEMYADRWQDILGQDVKEKGLYFTSSGQYVSV